ncbi:hypothetical protein [Pantoea anthophila]|uniref:hypothetical protein n=1 Tax=Pantoea anthophila TaxID=470931 RepID=UPI00301DD56A
MLSDLELVQSIIDRFDEKIKKFVSASEVELGVEANKSKNGLRWNNYSFKLRKDLPLYGLKLDYAQGILSYCTYFDEIMGECQATFDGLKRLVILPSKPAEIRIETPLDVWFFISHENEMDRFIGFLTAAKQQARSFI